MAKIILWLMLVLPWISLFFMNRHSLKRFMPVALLSSVLITVVLEMGYVYNWWTIVGKITPWEEFTSIPLMNGAFLVGTIWIFHFTYDKSFWVYILTNAIIDALYAFFILNVLIYFDVYRLERMDNLGIFMLIFPLAFILFAYQKWQDGIFINSKQPTVKEKKEHRWIIGNKEKAK